MPTVPKLEIGGVGVAGAPGAYVNPQGDVAKAFGESVGEAQSSVGRAIQRMGSGIERKGAGIVDMASGQIAGAEGTKKIGAALESAGDMLSKHALNLQDRHNQALATDMFVQWDKEASMEGAKFRTLQGMQASDALPDYMKEIETLRNKYSQNAPNVEVARLFDNDSKRRTGYMITDAAYYAGNQNKQYNKATANARQQLAIVHAGNAKDDKEFEDSVISGVRGVNAEAVESGWSREETDIRINKVVGTAWQARLANTAMTDPFRAESMYEANKGKIEDPVIRNHIEQNLIQQKRAIGTRDDAHAIANGVPFRAFPGKVSDAYDYTVKFFTDKGYSREAASAIAGHLSHESNFNPEQAHDNNTGYGLAGWRGDRLVALKQFASDRGKPVSDPDTQLEFLHQELQSGDAGAQRAGKELKAAKTVDEAVTAFMHFERPRGYTEATPTAGHGYGSRLARAQQAYGALPAPLTPDSGPEWLAGAIDRARTVAAARAPNDPMYEDMLVNRVKTEYNNVKTAKNQIDQANYLTMVGSLIKTDDVGKPAITNPSQIFDDPELNRTFHALPETKQKTVLDMVKKNATADVPMDDARLARYNQLKGMAALRPNEFREVDIMNEDLPRASKNQLFNEQRQIEKKVQDQTGLTRALNTVKSMTSAAGLFPGGSQSTEAERQRWDQFVGAFQAEREQHIKDSGGKTPSDEDNKRIAAYVLSVRQRASWLPWQSEEKQFEVPDEHREDITTDLTKRLSRSPTPAEVYRAYQIIRSRKNAPN